jgi:putative ABC transport system permease protein
MNSLWQDLRYGARMLVKKPGFTFVAVSTLALGIGANTAIFSIVNTVLFRPLPYSESERLVWLSERGPNFPTMSISYPNFTDWRAQQKVFEHLGVYNYGSYNLTGRGEPQRLDGVRISADGFAALRAQAAVGRVFNNDEDKPGAPPVVVLGHGVWLSRFGGDAGIVNQSITLDGRAYTVIGVMPADFAFPGRVAIWTPVGLLSSEQGYQNRDNHPGLMGVARLKPGVTLDEARSDMDAIAARLEQQYPASNKNVRVRVEPLLDNYIGDARWALWILLGAVGVVLLIACANVANLLLARAATRQREMAVRSALGASTWRIVRQLLTESLLLAAAGGALGLLLAQWAVPLILAFSGDAIPRAAEIGLDARVLAFTALVAMLTGVLFGLAPAWQASRPDVQSVLKETVRSTTGGRAALRQGLVVAEVALTLLLLVAAGLLLRSFHRLQKVNAGFEHEHALSFRLDLPERKYATGEQQVAFYQSLLEKLRGLPGVEAAVIASQLPLDNTGWQTRFLIEGKPVPPIHERPSMEVTIASSEYFRALGMRLLRGRYFTEQDNREHLRGRDLSGFSEGQRWGAGLNVVIVDDEFARRHWPNEDPIGKRVRLSWGQQPDRQPVLTVVGMVARVKVNELSEQGGFVQAYLSALQATSGDHAVVIKTREEPVTLVAAARQQVHSLDPEQPIYDVRTLTELRDRSLAPQWLNLTLLGSFAAVAMLLSVIGLYGVISYAVTQRTHEIGIRMALGARSRNVLMLVLVQGLKLVVIGIVIGLVASFVLTRLMRTLLYGVSATDPTTFVVIACLLIFVALLACWIPARRATKVDPMNALRYE